VKQINKYDKMPDHIKILDKILSFKGELRSFLFNMQFIQWNSICDSDYIWIILVDELDKLQLTG